MELPIAIRQLTELWGNDIVTESRILPMLGRKRCFTDFPEYREIYKSILNVGYAHRILNLLEDDNWRDELNELFNTFYSRMDYDEKDTFFVFESIAYGIGLCWEDDENIPVNLNYVDEEEENDDYEEEFDEDNNEENDVEKVRIISNQTDKNLYFIARSIVESYGKEIVCEKRFLNMLNDYHAFNENPALKHIFGLIIENGFPKRWIQLGDAINTNPLLSKEAHSIATQYGIKMELAEIAVNTMFCALGNKSIKDVLISKSDDKKFDKQSDLRLSLGLSPLEKECSNFHFIYYDKLVGRNSVKLKRDFKGGLYSSDGKAIVSKTNENMISYSIRQGTTYIADNAFCYSENDKVKLRHIDIPDSVVAIGYAAFKNANLYHLIIPNSVRYIGCNAFCDNNELTIVELPESLEMIDSEAFWGTSVKSVILPKNLKLIWGRNIFPKNTKIINRSSYMIYENGMLYNEDKTVLFACFSSSKVIHIEDTVEVIGIASFIHNEEIEEIYLGKNVRRIGGEAFWGCTNLKKVVCNSQLLYIESCVFEECFSLYSFILPASVREIETGAFENSAITDFRNQSPFFDYCDNALYDKKNKALIAYFGKDEIIYVKKGTEIIGRSAFMDNDYITTVVLPKSVRRIEYRAFYSCVELRKINLDPNRCEIELEAFVKTKFKSKFKSNYYGF